MCVAFSSIFKAGLSPAWSGLLRAAERWPPQALVQACDIMVWEAGASMLKEDRPYPSPAFLYSGSHWVIRYIQVLEIAPHPGPEVLWDGEEALLSPAVAQTHMHWLGPATPSESAPR